jgi:hypothetical protein
LQRVLAFVGFMVCSAAGFAQGTVNIALGSLHQFHTFEATEWPTKPITDVQKISGDKVTIKLTSKEAKPKLFIVDTETGNVAMKSEEFIRDGSWAVTSSSFLAVQQVDVQVSAPGGPVDSATVEIQDGLRKREELIDSKSAGKATFYFVQLGEVKVTVKYRGKNGMADPVKQSFTISLEREQPIPTLKIALPDGNSVASAEPAKTEAPQAGEKSAVNDEKIPTAPEATKSGPVGNLLTTLVGMGVVAAVAWYILKYMRENGDKVQDTLKKLGADLPQAPSADPDPAPIAPIKPEPMQQIILDSAPVAPVAPTPTPTGTPRLIATDGSAFDLPEGETTVGREFGNGLVVPSDTVSRRHASLLKSGSTVSVTDHGSTNGSWVNGMKVGGTVSLNPGDQVRFGSIEYQYEG